MSHREIPTIFFNSILLKNNFSHRFLSMYQIVCQYIRSLSRSHCWATIPQNSVAFNKYVVVSFTLTECKWVGTSQLCTEVFKSSVQFSSSVVSNSLRPHESQHTRPSCPSPTPGVHSDSRPSGQWCHPAISSSVIPFSSCPQSLPPSESFPMSQLFAWGSQSTTVSALASFLPKYTQGWSPSEWTGWISLQSKGLSESSPTPQFKSINSSAFSLLHSPTLTSIHGYWKNHSFD